MTNTLRELRKENKREIESLTEKDRKVLQQIREYFELPRMGAADRELLVRDLIGMAEEAEMRGQSLDEVIGEDKENWCKSIKEAYGSISTKERILGALKNGCGKWCGFWIILIGWGSEIKDAVTWLKLLSLVFCLIWEIAFEFFETRNHVFATEKEKTQADARAGFLWLAALMGFIALGMAVEALRQPAFQFTGASTVVWLAVLAAFSVSTALYRKLINSQLSGKR